MAAEVVAPILSEIGKKLIADIEHQIGYFTKYNNNIKNLKDRKNELKLILESVESSVNAERRTGYVILANIEGWKESANELLKEVTTFLEHDVIKNKGCLFGWCPNVKARYSLSRRATKMAPKVTYLREKGNEFIPNKICVPPRLTGMESNVNFHSFQSRERIMQEVKNIVKGGDLHMIGICGLGGVGKTTLIKEIGKWAHEEKLFDEIVMATVSKNPTLTDIQGELAVKLGLTFTEPELLARAARLSNRLLQDNMRNLVILDNVWESIDLEEIGIPARNGKNKNIIVMTSRNEDVCSAMKCDNIIKIDVLSEDEAWNLFREMAGGTFVDASDYVEVAPKVAKECGGLPIAIVTVGSALKGKTIQVWNDALEKFSQSIVPANLQGVEKKVFQSLELSYDQLNIEYKEAWSVLLLCCLYPEDANIPLEELVRYGMGMKLFKGIKLVINARDRVHALIEMLQKRFLLLDGDKPYTVKMHDVVRDVGIWIGSKNDHFNMVVVNGEWERDDLNEHCNALSVISSEITELPSGGLNCPELNLLHMSCDEISSEKLNVGNIFEGVKKLRVLAMFNMSISSMPSSLHVLTNLLVLNFESCWDLEDVCIPKELVNLEILSLRGCLSIKSVRTEMGRFTKLRVLDMRGCYNVESVMPGFISSMCRLEELYTETWPWDEEGNASLNELESLCNLTIIMTGTQLAKFLPKEDSVLEKLKSYNITISQADHSEMDFSDYPFFKKALFLKLNDITETLPRLGGIGKLLKESAEQVFLKGDGLVIALDELAAGGFRQLKELRIEKCGSEVVEFLAREGVNWPYSSRGVFINLEKLQLREMSHLKAILSCGNSGGGSFGNLIEIRLSSLPKLTQLWKYNLTIHPEPAAGPIKLSSLQHVELFECMSLEYVFTLSEAAAYLENLKTLDIKYCDKMEAVILENLGGSSPSDVNNVIIKFPKLETLSLAQLNSLTCFGSTAMEFPRLKELKLGYHQKINCLASMFSNKQVLFPSLETLEICGMTSKELWGSPYPASLFTKLEYLHVSMCENIRNIIPANSAQYLSGLTDLSVWSCALMEEVFESRGVNFGVGGGAILFNNLTKIDVKRCGSMKNLCSSSVARNLPNLLKLTILGCESVEEVIGKEEEEDGSNTYETIFPQLKKLRLQGLPCLTRFFHVDTNFKLPDGLVIDILGCPELVDLRSKATLIRLYHKKSPAIPLQEVPLQEVLQSVKRFFHVDSNFKLPDGSKIDVKDCPDFLILSTKAT